MNREELLALAQKIREGKADDSEKILFFESINSLLKEGIEGLTE